ncbi:MAG: cation:proton antiporter, partial [Thermoanaerobaculia bacterium]|nr:cation:proton antiporter [Thermoanaerobaculia bacterium]
AVLIAVAPVARDGDTGSLAASVGTAFVAVAASLIVFAVAVAAFSSFVEEPLTNLLSRLERAPERLVSVVGVGLIVAAIAGALGFSLAIGGFFAGVAFSRDPRAVRLDSYFDPLYDFFTPFFFITIGLAVRPRLLLSVVPLAAGLFLVAVVGKVIGTAAPALLSVGPGSALLIGLSMVPRAEVAMVILQEGVALGEWAVPDRVYSAMVLASLLTCTVVPVAIRARLQRLAASG